MTEHDERDDARDEHAADAAHETDDSLASVMNVESDAEDALADDPEPAPDGDQRDPEDVLRMDPSIQWQAPAAEARTPPRDQI